MPFETQDKPAPPGRGLITAGTAIRALGRWGLGCAHGSALLEALTTKDRTALRRTEGNRRVLTALGTSGLGLRAHLGAPICTAVADTFGTLGFATFATFGFVFEAFVGEKHLFAGGEDKFGTTFGTLQDLIVEFHEPLPLAQVQQGEGPHLAP